MNDRFMVLENGTSGLTDQLPLLEETEFRQSVLELTGEGCRVMAFFAVPLNSDEYRLTAVLGDGGEHHFKLTSFGVKGKYRSLTPSCAAFHRFEREIAEEYPIHPEGHPALHPVRKYADENQVGVNPFLRMKGDAVHEVAVGPIHAGVIEPGHFRFQCMGEDVYSLEIALGYQHRGIEKLLSGGPDVLTLHRIETAAGDSSIASAVTCCTMLESLGSCPVPDEVRLLRSIALELERIANHTGDLGALAGDVAFLPTASYCGRIRGEYLNMTAELCGNRFGRGLVIPGSCRYPLERDRASKILHWIKRVYPELTQALDLMLDSPSVLDRLENTGAVPGETAAELGIVGPAARASGLRTDSRRDFPLPGYDLPLPRMAAMHGDVMARALIRRLEIDASNRWLLEVLPNLEIAELPEKMSGELAPGRIAVCAVEGWRGEIFHAALTGADGRFSRYKIVDPSFHNWSALAMALRGEQISNFPICNKSFNLSYCGHDL